MISAALAQCADCAREMGDKWHIVHWLINVGRLVLYQGDYARAMVLLKESLAMWQEWAVHGTWPTAWRAYQASAG